MPMHHTTARFFHDSQNPGSVAAWTDLPYFPFLMAASLEMIASTMFIVDDAHKLGAGKYAG